MSRIVRIFFMGLGCVATVLGMVGVFLPGLPTTPLILLASWCFYKGSPYLRGKLLDSFLGRYIREYEHDRGLTVRKKIHILCLMTLMVFMSVIFFIDTSAIRLVVLASGTVGCLVVSFVVPTIKEK